MIRGPADKPSVVAVSRADVAPDAEATVAALRDAGAGDPIPVLSSVTGRGVSEVLGLLDGLVHGKTDDAGTSNT